MWKVMEGPIFCYRESLELPLDLLPIMHCPQATSLIPHCDIIQAPSPLYIGDITESCANTKGNLDVEEFG